MADSAKTSSLDGLVELSRRDGIDIKPTLLRVLTDLYVNKPTHTNEEERQFVELTRRLLDTVDVAVRAAVAKTLAAYAAAPLPLLRQLARDVITVAEPVLRKSKRLDSDELRAIVDEMGLPHAAIVAARFVQLEPDQEAEESTAPADVNAPERRAQGAPPAAASELSELFFAANAAERREILLNIEFAPLPPPRPPLEASETVRRLERAALQHHVEEVIREIARSLGLASEQARRIVGDLSGEAMVVAGKSLNMPSAVLQRILLFTGPAASQTVEHIYDLMRLYDEIKPEAAFRLLTIWQDTNTQRCGQQPSRSVDEGVRAREAHARPAPALLFEQRLHAEAPVFARPRQ